MALPKGPWPAWYLGSEVPRTSYVESSKYTWVFKPGIRKNKDKNETRVISTGEPWSTVNVLNSTISTSFFLSVILEVRVLVKTNENEGYERSGRQKKTSKRPQTHVLTVGYLENVVHGEGDTHFKCVWQVQSEHQGRRLSPQYQHSSTQLLASVPLHLSLLSRGGHGGQPRPHHGDDNEQRVPNSRIQANIANGTLQTGPSQILWPKPLLKTEGISRHFPPFLPSKRFEKLEGSGRNISWVPSWHLHSLQH